MFLVLGIGASALAFGQTYYANGHAKNTGGDCYELTSDAYWQLGSVWYADKIDLYQDFDLEFNMNFGSRDAGADGIVFVLQDKGNQALGQAGGGLGFEGFSPSLGIEFDDFYNYGAGDITQDHIAVLKNGSIEHRSSSSIHAPVEAIPGGGNIEDGSNHLVRVKWEASSKLLEVYFDCEKRISLTYDISQQIFNGGRYVFWGFTAATGGERNKQTVCLRKDILSRDTVPICKGDVVPLNARKSWDDTYRWWPSIDLDDTTVKRPQCSSIVPRTYYVEFKDLCGEREIDTVQVVIHTPFTMDEAEDSLLCNGRTYRLDLRAKYDSVRWDDGYDRLERWVRDPGYYKFRAWQGVCWDDDSMTIRTDMSPSLEISGDSFFCEGQESVLTLDAGPSSAVFSWHDGSTDSSFVATESIRSWVRSSNECGEQLVFYDVREIILPEITIDGERLYCEGDSVELEVLNSGTFIPIWQDSFTGYQRRGDSGLYEVRIWDQSCYSEDSFFVNYRPTPTAEVEPIPLLCEYEALFLTSDQDLTERRWSTGANTTVADYTLEEGQHWLKVYNGCGQDSVGFFIERKYCSCDLLVPNAFSPDGNTINDVFTAYNICDKLRSYNITIYDRWGTLLYESSDIEQGWDGTFRGSAMPMGVYLWVINYSGIEGRTLATYTRSGLFHLMR